MKVKDAVKFDEQIYYPTSKFSRKLRELLMIVGNEEYSPEIFNKCFDKALKTSKCEKCQKKSTHMTDGISYCNNHLKIVSKSN